MASQADILEVTKFSGDRGVRPKTKISCPVNKHVWTPALTRSEVEAANMLLSMKKVIFIFIF
jgi:hypothetical protein